MLKNHVMVRYAKFLLISGLDLYLKDLYHESYEFFDTDIHKTILMADISVI